MTDEVAQIAQANKDLINAYSEQAKLYVTAIIRRMEVESETWLSDEVQAKSNRETRAAMVDQAMLDEKVKEEELLLEYRLKALEFSIKNNLILLEKEK